MLSWTLPAALPKSAQSLHACAGRKPIVTNKKDKSATRDRFWSTEAASAHLIQRQYGGRFREGCFAVLPRLGVEGVAEDDAISATRLSDLINHPLNERLHKTTLLVLVLETRSFEDVLFIACLR